MNLKEMWKTPKGKLILAGSAMLISWIFLLLQFSGSLWNLFPSEERSSLLKSELKKLRQENAELRNRSKSLDRLKNHLKAQRVSFWQETRDGAIDTELRNRIQTAAKQSNLELSSLGSVRITKINNQLSYAELDLQASTSIEILIAFLGRVQEQNPLICWRRLDIRPDMRPRPTAGSNTTATAQLSINGAIRVITVTAGNEGGKQ